MESVTYPTFLEIMTAQPNEHQTDIWTQMEVTTSTIIRKAFQLQLITDIRLH